MKAFASRRAAVHIFRAMPFKLISSDGVLSFELRMGATLVVGRAPTSDIPVIDPTISRRHAEVDCTETGVTVRDLGSSNGTFVNGTRVDSSPVSSGDVLTFGKVAFRLQHLAPPPPPPTPTPSLISTPPGATIVRQFPLRDASSAPPDADKNRQMLATLLEISKGLGRATDLDTLLNKIVEYAYRILEVDRVAIMLTDDDGELRPKIARDKRGSDTARHVPQSIARSALNEKVAILSDNAGEDTRFGGQSILMQQIRSAICVPLIGAEQKSLGILYVDNVTATHRFSDDDFELCIAFAGIAAVAIENEQFSQRIQRYLWTRSNFERFFTPQLAKRIAEPSETIRLRGEKRPVAVLFSDIRGFTALAEAMRPDDMARLLTDYFTEMVGCVLRHHGALDKFIGDAVMAQWGAPIGGVEDADNAMSAAIEMIHELDKLNAQWRTVGRPQLQIGIGLNFGEAFAGNIGSERRLEFTLIGNTVNTAKRLCDIAEPRQILLSDEFRRMLRRPPRVVECPPMELKNKSQPVTVFRVALD